MRTPVSRNRSTTRVDGGLTLYAGWKGGQPQGACSVGIDQRLEEGFVHEHCLSFTGVHIRGMPEDVVSRGYNGPMTGTPYPLDPEDFESRAAVYRPRTAR